MVSRFNSRPSRRYQEVVAHLRSLDTGEQNQAFAEAHAAGLRSAVATWLGKQAGGIKSWKRLFGCSPKADDGLPGDDHVELWSSDEGMRYVSHPYDLDFETLKEMVHVADEHGLEFSVSGTSWYYPGRTMRVLWRPKR